MPPKGPQGQALKLMNSFKKDVWLCYVAKNIQLFLKPTLRYTGITLGWIDILSVGHAGFIFGKHKPQGELQVLNLRLEISLALGYQETNQN